MGLWKSRPKTWRIGLGALTTMEGKLGISPAQFDPTSLFFTITVFFDTKGNKVFFFFSLNNFVFNLSVPKTIMQQMMSQ